MLSTVCATISCTFRNSVSAGRIMMAWLMEHWSQIAIGIAGLMGGALLTLTVQTVRNSNRNRTHVGRDRWSIRPARALVVMWWGGIRLPRPLIVSKNRAHIAADGNRRSEGCVCRWTCCCWQSYDKFIPLPANPPILEYYPETAIQAQAGGRD